MSKATKLWDEWYPQFIAKHNRFDNLVPELSYDCGVWTASIESEQCEPYEGTWWNDIGVCGSGKTPLAAVTACIDAGERFELTKARKAKHNELR